MFPPFFFFGTQSKQVLRLKEARDEILFCTIPDMICTKGGRSYNFNNTSRVVRELRVRLLIVYLECLVKDKVTWQMEASQPAV